MTTFARTTGVIVIVAAIWWWAVFLTLHVLQPGISPIKAPGSAYVTGPYGALATTMYYALSAALLGAGLGLARQLPATTVTRVATVAFVIAGIASVLAGLFPMDFPGPPRTQSGYLHALGGGVGFPAWMLGTILFSFSSRRDRQWQRSSRALFALAMTGVGIFAVLLLSVIILGFGGYAQRLLVSVLFAWMIVVALHLVRSSPASNDTETAARVGAALR